MTMMVRDDAVAMVKKGQTSCAGAFCVASLMASLAVEHSDVTTPDRKRNKPANNSGCGGEVASDAETESGSVAESSSCHRSTSGSATGYAETATSGSPNICAMSASFSDSDEEVDVGEWKSLGGRLVAGFAKLQEAANDPGEQIDVQGWKKVSTAFVQAIDDMEELSLDEHLDYYLGDDDTPDADDLDDRLAFPVLLRGKRKYSPGGRRLSADIDAWHAVGVKVHHGLSSGAGENFEQWHRLGSKVSQRFSEAFANLSDTSDTDLEWK